MSVGGRVVKLYTGRAAPNRSTGLQRRDHRNSGQHDTTPVTDFGTAVSVCEDWRQWPTVWRAEPKAKQMSFPLGLGPILVISAIVQDHVVVDELDVARLELDIEVV